MPAPNDQSPGRIGICGERTGFFHVEELDGVWWAIDPTGTPCFLLGTDHVNYEVHHCERLACAPYHRNVRELYTGEDEWAASAVERLKSWGFNTLGSHSSESVRHRGLPHMENLRMGAAYARRDAIVPPTRWTGFPNVFADGFGAFCDEWAAERCAPQADDPWLVGWFIDNELEWHLWTTAGIVPSTLTRPADHPAKRALVELLRKRHGTIDSFNRVWGLQPASFEDLAARTDWEVAEDPAGESHGPTEKAMSQDLPGCSEAALADRFAFIHLVAERYFTATTAAIRRHDPNHMILGCRYAGQAMGTWDVAGRYCDIVSVNCYRQIDLETGRFTDGFPEQLAGWHERCGRPMMITEWSYPALDAGLPCQHGAGQRVPTQKDRAFAFTVFQRHLLSQPFMVGSNYFMWVDEPELGISLKFPEDSNYGLVDVNDEPYTLLTEAATKLHAQACAIHAAGG